MLRLSGKFTSILKDWATQNQIDDPDLASRLDVMRDRAFVDTDRWREALDRAARVTRNPAVGLQIGTGVKLSHVGVLGYLVLNSQHLADALETYVLSERHFYGISFAELSNSDQGWTLAWPDRLGDRNGLFVQVAFSVLVTFMRQRFPGRVVLRQVSLTGAALPDAATFETFFQCPVSFGSTRPSLTFSDEGLFAEGPGRLPEEFQTMRQQQIDATSGIVMTSDPFLRRLQISLLDRIPENRTSLAQVAQDLAVSPRTLQRKLEAHGLGYQGVLDGVREALARRYLLRTLLTLTEVAHLVGFAEQSAFNRAFRSWTGVTPGRFRKAPQN